MSTLHVSLGLRNTINSRQSLKHTMSNCFLKLYGTPQPASAEAAPTGTLLCVYSAASGTPTREVLAVGSLTLSGTSGTANTFTLNGIEIMGSGVISDGTVAGTATLVAAAINHNPANIYVDASTTGASGVITLTARRGLGDGVNTWVLAGTGTTISFGSAVAMTGGVTPLNGLRWGASAAGVLAKHPTQIWSGIAVTGGTAVWGRFEAATTDSGLLDTTESQLRMDGNVGVTGAGTVIELKSTTIIAGLVHTIDVFDLALPTA